MKIHLKKWMRGAFMVSLLLGVTASHATITAFEEQILADTGFGGTDKYAGGQTVAISGEWAFVGMGDHPRCQVFVYKFDVLSNRWGDGLGNVGLAYTKLNNTNASCAAANVEGFGSSLSVDKGFVVVGAPLADVNTTTQDINNAGRVFLYKYDATNTTCDTATCRKGWTLTATAEGAVDWNLLGTSTQSDAQKEAEYGASVSIRQDKDDPSKAMLVIGAPFYDYNQNIPGQERIDSGKVYFWEWDGSQFNFMAAGAGQNAGDQAGTTVTSNGSEMLASAPYYDDNGNLPVDSGAAYLFDYDDTTTPPSLKEEHVFKSGNTYNETNGGGTFTLTLDPNFHLGMTLSYVDSVIALGGIDTNGFDHDHATGILTHRNTAELTYEGDVSQSGSVIVVAKRGVGAGEGVVNIFVDKYNTDPTNPTYQITKTEDDWGRDVSVSIPNIMVNGNNGSGLDGKAEGVAYAYFAGCGFGGELHANEWKMIGPQCEVYSDSALTVPATIAEVYADLGTYGTDWIMTRQDGANYDGHQPSYVFMTASESMEIGVGYWIISLTDATYQVSESLFARYIHKTLGVDPLSVPDDSYDRSNIRAVTDLNLRDMMGGITNGSNGDADVRTMLSNPLIAPTVWADAYMYTGSDVDTNWLVGDSAGAFFEARNATAYLWHNGTAGGGTVGDGFIPVSGAPGMTHKIVGGEGFSVKFSVSLTSMLKDTVFIPSLHLAEQY